MFADRVLMEDEDDEPDHVLPVGSPVPTVASPVRRWEYRTEPVALTELIDPTAFAARLNQASDEGWDLVEIVDAGDQKVLVLRRPRASTREYRRVGFTPRAEG